MSNEKQFPILGHKELKSLLWSAVEPYRKQAEINHGQTLEQLAARGGLDLSEIICIMSGERWHRLFTKRTK